MTKILTREAIQRMMRDANNVQRGQGGSGSGGGGGQAVSLANLSDVAISTPIDGGSVLTFDETAGAWVNGPDVLTTMWGALEAVGTEQIDASHLTGVLGDYATETWVSQNFISIAYFDRLFRAYNGSTLVNHNDTESTITSIEAMFGFWTEQYLSALGNSGGGSVSLTLANMGDVALNNLADGQILVYDATEGKWVNESASIVGNYLPLTGGTLTGNLNLTQGVGITSGGQTLLVYQPSGLSTISSTQWGVGATDSQGVIRSSASDLLHWRGSVASGQAYAILDEYNVKTINGQSIYGTGNIEVGGGASGNYLPLSGGTLTNSSFGGALTIKRSTANGGSAIRYSNNNVVFGSLGFDASGNLAYWTGSSSAIEDKFILATQTWVNGQFLPLTGGTLTGRLTINASVPDAFVLNRTSANNVVRMDMAQGGTVYGNLGLDASHNIILRTTSGSTHTVRLQINTNGNVGIGTTSPNYKLHVNGTLGAGNTSVANLESEGYVSALSDIRKKDVVEYMDGLPIEQIASMRIIRYTWKDRPEDGLQVGSIAQDWQRILPESVHTTRKGFLSFADSRAALVGTISNSRELVKHDERLTAQDLRLSKIEKILNIA